MTKIGLAPVIYNSLNIKILCCICLIVLETGSCKNRAPVIDGFNGFIQGTTYSIVYENNKSLNNEDVKIKIEKVLKDFDLSLSLYNDSSIISRINRNENVTIDRYFQEVFEKSTAISKMTDGAFDITVAPLVRAWGFGPDAKKNFTESKRDSLLDLVGMDKVTLIRGKVVKSDPRITLDVNAIAQGYSVDVVCKVFDEMGIKNYLVEIGGEVRAKGTKAGALWRIGIDKPIDNNNIPGESLQAIIRISDKALATSGNYRKFYIENGIKYSHTIDPRTGYPTKNKLLSATILADECATADGIATACMVMGKDAAIEFINGHPEFTGYLVFSDEKGNYLTWESDGLKEYLTEEN